MEQKISTIEKKLEELDSLSKNVHKLVSFLGITTSNNRESVDESDSDTEVESIPDSQHSTLTNAADKDAAASDNTIRKKVDGGIVNATQADRVDTENEILSDDANANTGTQASTSTHTSLSDRLKNYEKNTPVAPAIDEDLAKFVNKSVTHNLDSKYLEEVKGKYVRPENTPYLVAPRVNPEIWKLIPPGQAQQEEVTQR